MDWTEIPVILRIITAWLHELKCRQLSGLDTESYTIIHDASEFCRLFVLGLKSSLITDN